MSASSGRSGTTPLANAVASPPPLERTARLPRAAPVLRAAPGWLRAGGVAVLGLILSQYLAGCLLAASLRLDARSASPLTVARYAYYYGDRADVRRRLWLASGMGLTVVALCAALALRPRARSLHGDARFATR